MVHQLGELLRRRREDLGLSKREVAERAGVNHSAIARVEAGRRRISLELFQRVAEALDLQLVVLLERPASSAKTALERQGQDSSHE
jgi:transcriptional regulator with XRE-family HTH domain